MIDRQADRHLDDAMRIGRVMPTHSSRADSRRFFAKHLPRVNGSTQPIGQVGDAMPQRDEFEPHFCEL